MTAYETVPLKAGGGTGSGSHREGGSSPRSVRQGQHTPLLALLLVLVAGGTLWTLQQHRTQGVDPAPNNPFAARHINLAPQELDALPLSAHNVSRGIARYFLDMPSVGSALRVAFQPAACPAGRL